MLFKETKRIQKSNYNMMENKGDGLEDGKTKQRAATGLEKRDRSEAKMGENKSTTWKQASISKPLSK